MHVAVCIVSYRNPGDVKRCLDALARSTHPDFEVVICENGGAAAFEALKAEEPDSLPGGQPINLILASGNLGYAGGVNVCLDAAPDADAWWILNPDTEASPNAIIAMQARLAEGGCDLVGATMLTPEGRVDSRALRWSAWLARSESIDHGTDPGLAVNRGHVERQATYVCGGSMFVTRKFVNAVGPMREDYFLYCEEIEWCLRGRQRGLRIGYAPDAHVVHLKGTTTGAVPALAKRPRGPVFLDERNKLLVTRDFFPRRLPIVAVAALAVLVLRFGRRGAWKQLGWALSGWLAGLRNRRGAPAWFQ